MKRPDFMPEDSIGPTANCPHAAKRFAGTLADQVRIEEGILEHLPVAFQREQQLRVLALKAMHAEAKEYAFYLWRKERST
jgi:hypothetical protein